MKDVTLRDEGSIFLFILNTKKVREWVKENLATEPYQWLSNHGLTIEHRYAPDIAQLLKDNGFTVGEEDV